MAESNLTVFNEIREDITSDLSGVVANLRLLADQVPNEKGDALHFIASAVGMIRERLLSAQ